MGQPCTTACKGSACKRETRGLHHKGQTLEFTVMGARNLRNTDSCSGPDRFFYCTFRPESWDAELVFSTRWISNVVDPVWNEEAELPNHDRGDALYISVWEADAEDQSELVGSCHIEPERFERGGFNGELTLRDQYNQPAGYLRCSVTLVGHSPPPGPPQQLAICIDSFTKEHHGLQYDELDGSTIYITSIRKGPIAAYNEDEKWSQRVVPGLFIMSVNGVDGNSKAMVAELNGATEGALDLVLRRPRQWRVAIWASSAKEFGLEFSKKKLGNALLITKVVDASKTISRGGATKLRRSVTQEWNAEQPDQKICAGDRVIAVNGYKGKAAYLYKKIQMEFKTGRFHLTLVRPASLE